MQLFVSISLVLVTLVQGYEHPVSYARHQVISVIPNTAEDLEFLSSLQSPNVDLWNAPVMVEHAVMMRLHPEVQQEIHSLLETKNMEVKIVFEDVQKVITKEKIWSIQPFSQMQETGIDFSRYHNLPEVMVFMKDLIESHPEIAELESIGMSYQNRSIDVIKIGGNKEQNKPLIVLEFGMHSREWISVSTAIYIMNRLVTSYGEDDYVTELVDKFEFIIIPVANPDGYYHSHTVDRYWRKTLSKQQPSGCLGVDGNRNFDVNHCDDEDSREPCYELYCGPEPFSESETRAIRDLLMKNKERVAAFFDVHSFSQLWMSPYGYTVDKPFNHEELKRIGEIGINALAEKYGTKFKYDSVIESLYKADGLAIDYVHEKIGIDIVFALELRDEGEYGFHLPEKQILPTCEETYDGIMAAVNAIQI